MHTSETHVKYKVISEKMEFWHYFGYPLIKGGYSHTFSFLILVFVFILNINF